MLAEIYRRNAIRREAKLPLLDVRVEQERDMAEARLNEWWAFCDEHKATRDQIKTEVLAEFRQRYGPDFPVNSISGMAVEIRTNQRFAEFAASKGMEDPSIEAPHTFVYGSDHKVGRRRGA